MSNSNHSKPRSADDSPSFRFGIWHLLYGTALIASGLVVAGPWSLLISGVVLAGWFIAYREDSGCLNMVIFLAVSVVLIGLFLPAVEVSRGPSRRIVCLNNIRQCMLALHSYESAYTHMPEAYSVDDQGRPMHSWRVRILPFFEEDSLFASYDFKEPWDGPNNSKLANQMPSGFRCPSMPDSNSETTYKLVSDPESFFDADKRRDLEDAVDGSSCTIVMVEDCNNPVNWMKPEGISIEAAIAGILCSEGCHCDREETLLTTTYFGPAVGVLDDSVHRIAPNADPESLRQALRFADGHSPDVSDFTGTHVVHKPQGYIALGLYLFLLALPGWFWLSRKRIPKQSV